MVDDVPGSLELHTETDLHNVAESVMRIILLCDSKTSTNNRGKKRKLCESVPKWRKVKPTYTKVHKRDSDHDACLKKMKEFLKSSTPAEIFEKL